MENIKTISGDTLRLLNYWLTTRFKVTVWDLFEYAENHMLVLRPMDEIFKAFGYDGDDLDGLFDFLKEKYGESRAKGVMDLVRDWLAVQVK